MDIDLIGILFLSFDLLWMIYWPIPLALIYIVLFRKYLSRKLIFLISCVALGFAINLIYEFGFLKLFVVDPLNPHVENLNENAGIYLALLLFPKIATSLLLYWLLSKMKIFKLQRKS
jgi:hypothetical protein